MAYRRRKNGDLYYLTDANEAKAAGQGSYKDVRGFMWLSHSKTWSYEINVPELVPTDEVLPYPPGNIWPCDAEPGYRLVEVNGPEGRYTRLEEVKS